MTEMQPRYEPQGVEERWQRTWEEEGLYRAVPDPSRTPYVDCHPPPNVTGELHMGHALQLAVGDTLIRTKRMQGYDVLFQPGYDHAGISTQNAVEKALVAEGTSRRELGREAFEQRVWEWLHLYGGKILVQFRRMGASMDYSRTRFTMDDDYVRAVMRFFVHLYRKGWIYRANRIINWCPFHETSLSDLELIHEDKDDTLTTIRYPLADGDGGISIATVRPATIPADVAVAVHPDDERYRHLIGREVIVPWVERRVPVIADERVERDFGTGALKITPAHDPTDFAIGRDHGLPEPSAIGPNGRMTAEGLEGLTQKEAEEKILDWLREHGQLEKREHYRHSVALCERCESRIEPTISLQWWCSMDELKLAPLEKLRAREVVYHPESQHRYAIDSLENAPDWNISRQIWWGHQLPVWTCPDGHLTVEETEPAACAECGSPELTRETDVLDTWFSSALWPFATLGWPDETPELEQYYPGNLQTTAREIIRLWENRMIFCGLELLGELPFRDVIIHSTVLAPDGRRMSKSLGTGIDPLEIIEQYGTDATRYGLLKNSLTQDVRFSYSAIEEGAKLSNKLWNAARLIVTACEGAAPAERPASLEERWILARLSQTQREVERLLGEFDLAHAADEEPYHLTFDDFCDWFLEAVKGRLYDGDADARATATAALERLLKLLHPLMPHVTEEIWSHLPARETRLIVAAWPEAGDEADANALQRVQEAAQTFRRAGVLPALEGDEKRIFDAVVKPERSAGRANGDVETERARLRKEIARGEGMLGNERFVQNAPPEVVAAEREKLERYRRDGSTLSPAEIRQRERVAYDLWVAPEAAEQDGWVLRHASGLTGRANSVWPNGAGVLPLAEKIDRAEGWYAERGLPARYQLTDGSLPGALEEALVERGYRRVGDEVAVETARLVDAPAPESFAGQSSVALAAEVDDQWLALWTETRAFDRVDVAQALLSGSPGSTAFARVGDVAVGRGVAVGEWLGVTSMATIPAARRQGHGRAMLSSLLAWGRERGCTRGILQVEAGNDAARGLYRSFGFRPGHTYRYLVAP